MALTVVSAAFVNLIFDEMFDNDMLGLMLSSVHLKLFLKAIVRFDEKTSDLICRTICDEKLFQQLQNTLLEKFEGFFIQECSYGKDALYQSLDQKIRAYTLRANGLVGRKCECFIAPDEKESNPNIELAWNYRKACVTATVLKLK